MRGRTAQLCTRTTRPGRLWGQMGATRSDARPWTSRLRAATVESPQHHVNSLDQCHHHILTGPSSCVGHPMPIKSCSSISGPAAGHVPAAAVPRARLCSQPNIPNSSLQQRGQRGNARPPAPRPTRSPRLGFIHSSVPASSAPVLPAMQHHDPPVSCHVPLGPPASEPRTAAGHRPSPRAVPARQRQPPLPAAGRWPLRLRRSSGQKRCAASGCCARPLQKQLQSKPPLRSLLPAAAATQVWPGRGIFRHRLCREADQLRADLPEARGLGVVRHLLGHLVVKAASGAAPRPVGAALVELGVRHDLRAAAAAAAAEGDGGSWSGGAAPHRAADGTSNSGSSGGARS